MSPAVYPEAARERDLHRYYQPWLDAQSLVNVNNQGASLALTYKGFRAQPSRDKALTAFAQLAALRLGVRRAMVSLVDAHQQYILAEATKTLSLIDDLRHGPGDGIWLGQTVIARHDGVEENLFGSRYTATDDDGSTYTGEGLVIPDLRLDDRFKDRDYVKSEPAVRFYAGVPIRTRAGHRIGAYSVSDNNPRHGLTVDEFKFMQDVAATVMEHLEMAKDRDDRNKGERMVRGLADFIEGVTIEPDGPVPAHLSPTIAPNSSEDKFGGSSVMRTPSFRSHSATLKKQTENSRIQDKEFPRPTRGPSFSSSTLPVSIAKPERTEHEDDIGHVFHRAASIIRASTDQGAGISSDEKSDPEHLKASRGTSSTAEYPKKTKKKDKLIPTELLKVLPGIRSLIFLPMWDPTVERWVAGAFIWTSTAGRLMSPDNELPYLKAFSNSIMSEVARVNAQKADRAKTTFIASISHELRSPLHGILGSVEFLHETAGTSYQASLFTSIEICGKTLLDTIDHVLDYAKINKLGRSHKRKKHEARLKQVPNGNDNSVMGVTAEFDLNTGIGMSVEYQRTRLFSPFSQEDPFAVGTGLGLSIVRQIIDSLGGTIDMKSTKNVGTEVDVFLTLPLSAQQANDPESTIMPAAISTRGMRACLLIPEASKHQDFTGEDHRLISSFRDTCYNWFEMDFIESTTAQSVDADIFFVTEPSLVDKLFEFHASKSGTAPLVIVCRNPSEEIALKSREEHRLQALGRHVTVVSQPMSGSEEASGLEIPERSLLRDAITASAASPSTAIAPTPAENALNRDPSSFDNPHLRILVVDDNPINLQLLVMFMKKHKFAYTEATNGLEAFERYKDATMKVKPSQQHPSSILKSFDFVLMDISMPVMDGLASTREIRRYEHENGVMPAKIVALTGLASAQAQEEAMGSGIDDYLPKPVKFAELKKLVEKKRAKILSGER
ncbi:putative histidine kinase g7 [Diplodia seriata]|uniref:histidine kinase n=1 Tax=Diplodia seriata TaxID=420778 RepID=A0A0G2GRK7_9PEZI|nr:putative histidine kinase g7 [Diplodia seriata]